MELSRQASQVQEPPQIIDPRANNQQQWRTDKVLRIKKNTRLTGPRLSSFFHQDDQGVGIAILKLHSHTKIDQTKVAIKTTARSIEGWKKYKQQKVIGIDFCFTKKWLIALTTSLS